MDKFKKVLAIACSFTFVTWLLCLAAFCTLMYISFGPKTLEVSSQLFK